MLVPTRELAAYVEERTAQGVDYGPIAVEAVLRTLLELGQRPTCSLAVERALVEQYLAGPEFTVAVVGHDPPRALPVLRRAVELGVEALVVSNHGGRQLDFLPGAVDVLPEVVDAVLKVFLTASAGQRALNSPRR